MNEIEIAPVVCAPMNYPVNARHIMLYGEEELETVRGGIFINDGVGIYGGVNGKRISFIPRMAEIVWFSFVDKQAYHLKTDLDFANISNIYNAGYCGENGVVERFSQFYISLFPSGIVVFYLGGYDKMVDVGQYKARPVDLPVDVFIENTAFKSCEEYANSYLNMDIEGIDIDDESELDTNELWIVNYRRYGVDYSLLSKYFQKFYYAICIGGKPLDNLSVKVEYSNFCFENYYPDNNSSLVVAKCRSRVKSLLLSWTVNEKNIFADVYLDENEVIEAFDGFDPVSSSERKDLVFRIEVSQDLKGVELLLKSETAVYEFRKTRFRIASFYKKRMDILCENFTNTACLFRGE